MLKPWLNPFFAGIYGESTPSRVSEVRCPDFATPSVVAFASGLRSPHPRAQRWAWHLLPAALPELRSSLGVLEAWGPEKPLASARILWRRGFSRFWSWCQPGWGLMKGKPETEPPSWAIFVHDLSLLGGGGAKTKTQPFRGVFHQPWPSAHPQARLGRGQPRGARLGRAALPAARG